METMLNGSTQEQHKIARKPTFKPIFIYLTLKTACCSNGTISTITILVKKFNLTRSSTFSCFSVDPEIRFGGWPSKSTVSAVLLSKKGFKFPVFVISSGDNKKSEVLNIVSRTIHRFNCYIQFR